MRASNLRCLLSLLAAIAAGTAAATPVVHTADFIADGWRTNFNGFEAIPNDGVSYTGASGPYVEDSVAVQQIDGDAGNSIWVTYNPPGKQGLYSWYPNGGDAGYTSITRSGGIDFVDVGMLIGSGNGGHTAAYYELWNDGNLMFSGSVAHAVSFHYLGFSGGGFDTILIRDGVPGATFGDGGHNALNVDAIELAGRAVPEPRTLALLGLAGLAAGASRRQRWSLNS